LFAGISPKDILPLMGESRLANEANAMRAYAHFYDQRGGGIEISFGEEKGVSPNEIRSTLRASVC
jgi:hypothetical protein